MKNKKLIGICITAGLVFAIILTVHIVGGNLFDMMKTHMGM